MTAYYVKLSHTIRVLFGTSSSTGAAINADALPTVTVYEQGTALSYAPVVTNKATGLYEVAIDCTTGNGFEVGKEYSASVAAAVAGITGRDGIASFAITAAAPDDLATAAALATVQADTDNIQTRLPGALVGGRMDSSVGAMAADVLTTAAIAADAVTEIQAGLALSTQVDTVEAGIAAINTDTDDLQTRAADIQARLPLALVAGRMDSSIGAVANDAITAASLAADVTTELQSGLATAANQATIIGHVDTVEATLATVLGLIDTEIASIKTTVEALPSSSANAAAVLAAVVQTGFTLQRYLKIIGGAVAGKKAGDVFRDLADTQDQITGTSTAGGDRTAATYGA